MSIPSIDRPQSTKEKDILFTEKGLQNDQINQITNVYAKTLKSPYSGEEISRYCEKEKPDIPLEIKQKIYKSYYQSIIRDEIQKLIATAKEYAVNIEDDYLRFFHFSRIAAEEACFNPKAAELTLQTHIPGFIPLVLDGMLPKTINHAPNCEALLDTIFSYQGDLNEAFAKKKEKDLSVKELCYYGFAKLYINPKDAFEILIKLKDKIEAEADEELLFNWFMHLINSLMGINLDRDAKRVLDDLETKMDDVCDKGKIQDKEKNGVILLFFLTLQEKYDYSLNTTTNSAKAKLDEIVSSVNKLITDPNESLASSNNRYVLKIVDYIRALKLLV